MTTYEYDNNLDAKVRCKLIGRLSDIMDLPEGIEDTRGNVDELSVSTSVEEFKSALVNVTTFVLSLTQRAVGNDTIPIVCDGSAFTDDKRTNWEVELAGVIARACLCLCSIEPQHVTFIGQPFNTATAIYVWTQLAYRLDISSTLYMRECSATYKAQHGTSLVKQHGPMMLVEMRKKWIYDVIAQLRCAVNEYLLQETSAKDMLIKTDIQTLTTMRQMFPTIKFVAWDTFNVQKGKPLAIPHYPIAPGLTEYKRSLIANIHD